MGFHPTYGGARRGVGRLLPVVLPLLVTAPLAPPAAPPVAIVDVRLLPMDGSGPRDSQSVLIEGDRIRWVGSASDLAAPEGALVVDGRGRTLMPGLADMHVHLMILGHSDYEHWDTVYPPQFRNVIMPISAKQLLMAGVTGEAA